MPNKTPLEAIERNKNGIWRLEKTLKINVRIASIDYAISQFSLNQFVNHYKISIIKSR